MNNQDHIKDQFNFRAVKRYNLTAGFKAGPKLLEYSSMALIALVTLMTLWSSLRNGFVNYDDNVYIYENESIMDFSVNGILSFFTGIVGQYPPLVMTIFSVLYHFFGLDPLPYHVVSLGLHVMNSLLVFLFVYRFDKKVLGALIAGLFFGIHPLHVESVAWATELKDVLYTFFFLLGLLSYHTYLSNDRKRRYLVYCLVLFVLSCLSKGMAVVFPLVLILIDYYILEKITWKDLLVKIPFFGIALIWGLLTFITQQSIGALDGSDSISFFQRIFIAAYGVLFYIVKMIVPINLSVFYAFPNDSGGMLPWVFYIAPVIVLVIGIGVYFSGKYRKILMFGLLFYLVNLLLVLQLIPVGMAIVADRYFYLASVGLFLITGMGVDHLIRIAPKARSVVLSGIVIIAAGLSILTNTQLKVWESSISLWNQVLQDARPYRGYALAYTNRGDARSDLNDFEAAVKDYDKAVELNSEYVDAYNNRGLIKGLSRKYTEAKLDFDEAIRLRPNFAKAYNNRGNVNRFLGNAEAALSDFDKAISIKPGYLDAYINRGIVLYLVGDSIAACRDWKKVHSAGSRAADQLIKDYCK